jgi:hypothetical protein
MDIACWRSRLGEFDMPLCKVNVSSGLKSPGPQLRSLSDSDRVSLYWKC